MKVKEREMREKMIMNSKMNALKSILLLAVMTIALPRAAWCDNDKEEAITPDTTVPPAHISLTEADFYAGLAGELGSMRSGFTAGGSANVGYRFLGGLDSRFLSGFFAGVYGRFGTYASGITTYMVGPDLQYHFCEDNSGFVIAAAVTYGGFSGSAAQRGVGVAPRIQYHIPFGPSFSIALEVAAPVLLVNPSNPFYSGGLDFQFWF